VHSCEIAFSFDLGVTSTFASAKEDANNSGYLLGNDWFFDLIVIKLDFPQNCRILPQTLPYFSAK
jgi:hypothetical protein